MAEGEVYSLAALEPHYSGHMNAMTTEGLQAKSDIASQLALRDLCINHLEQQNRVLGLEVDRQKLVVKRMVQKASHQAERIKYLETKLYARDKSNG